MSSPAFWPGTVVFYALAALVIGCAALVAFSRNMLHSALALLGTLAGVAGLYLHLGADFLGITQLLIYVGGILVLVLFAVLLTTQIGDVKASNTSLGRALALPVAGARGRAGGPGDLGALARDRGGGRPHHRAPGRCLPARVPAAVRAGVHRPADGAGRGHGAGAPGGAAERSAAHERAGSVGLSHYLVVSAVLFALGLYTVTTRRSAVAILMGVELILNAAALNFAAFAHFVHGAIAGQVITLFIVVLAAAEAAVALAIVLAIWRSHQTVDATRTATLRD